METYTKYSSGVRTLIFLRVVTLIQSFLNSVSSLLIQLRRLTVTFPPTKRRATLNVGRVTLYRGPEPKENTGNEISPNVGVFLFKFL
jgi:hypothetical protein